MGKKLLKILAPIIFSAGVLLNGCGDPVQQYKDSLKYENLKTKQKQFVDNMHKWYGAEVSYNEAKSYTRSRLSGWDFDIVKHGLKKHVEKTGNKTDISDEALVVLYEAIEKFD